MDSPSQPPWSDAALAAYFGDLLCRFCDHYNPAGAKFCNDCGSPLHLKPCEQCDAVNHRAATNCYKCGAECPGATPVLPAAEYPRPESATTSDVDIAAAVTQPLFAASALPAGWRWLRPGQVLLAAIAMILLVGAYVAYRINAAAPDAIEVASQPIAAGELNESAATSAVPMMPKSKPVEPTTLPAAIATINAVAPKRVSAHQGPVPVSVTKRASARQRPAPKLQAPKGATPPVAQSPSPAQAHVGVPVAHNAQQDPWQAMQVSLASCGGDLFARIVCDQRVRRRFCENHWGEAPECASIASDHGQ